MHETRTVYCPLSQTTHLSSRNMSRCFLSLLLFMLAACGGGEDRGKRRGGWARWAATRSTGASSSRPPVHAGAASELVTHGSLESEAMADITPEAAGVVTEVRAEEGERVARGQVLAVLSSPSLEAGSERAKVELSQARRRFEQSKVLHGTGAISDSEFLEAQDAFEIAKASFNEARGTRGFTADQPDRRHRRTAECAPGRLQRNRPSRSSISSVWSSST